MSVNRVIVAAVLANVFCASAPADTLVSPEEAAVAQLATALKLYSIAHQGERVRTWAQVGEVYDLNVANRRLKDRAAYPLKDHYAFIAQPVAFPGYLNSELVLLRTVPLQHALGKPQWRYAIGRTQDGETTSTRVTEEQVQAMFQKAGVALPVAKLGLAVVENETVLEPLPVDAPSISQGEASKQPRRARDFPPPSTSTEGAPGSNPPTMQSPATPWNGGSQLWPWLVGSILLGVCIWCFFRRSK